MPPSDAKRFTVPRSGDHPVVLLLEVAFALVIAISAVLLRSAWAAEGLSAAFTLAVWVLLALLAFPALTIGLVVARMTGSTIALTPTVLYIEGPFGRWHHVPRAAATITPLGFHLLEEKPASPRTSDGPAAWAVHMPGLPAAFTLTRLLYPAITRRAFILTTKHTDHTLLLAALNSAI